MNPLSPSSLTRWPLPAIALALLLLSPTPQSQGQVVATVDGTPIFQRQVDLALRRQVNPSLLAQLPPEQRQAALEQAGKAVLNELAGRILLVNAARREGLQISPDDLRIRLEAITNQLAGGQNVDDFLAQNGLDKEEFLRDVEESLLIERLIEAKTRDLPPPTEDEIGRYYRENPAEFRQAENVRVRLISLSIRGLTDPLQIDAKRRRLEEIRRRLLSNPVLDFAKIAAEESESASSLQGGLIGPFGRGQNALEPELEEAAFTQEPGALGNILATASGFHLLRVEERNPPGTLRYEEVRSPIGTYLTQMKRRDFMTRLIDEWRTTAKIERVIPAAPPSQAPPTPAPAPAPATPPP